MAALAPLETQQLVDLVEREPEQLLHPLDKADDSNRVYRKLAVTAGAPGRLREEPATFVIANRLNIDAGLLSCLTHPHAISMNPAR